MLVKPELIWGRGSAGRAPRSQRGGRGFESPRLHQIINHLLLKRILSVGGFFMLEDPWTWRLPKVFGEIKRLVKFEFIK
jgi:hypothetical protein